jgi:molecular chaperone DnaK (HSP70)
MSDAILVIDFGTSTSSAALVAGGETILIKEPSSGSSSWPSAVYLDDKDVLLVGSLATSRMQVRPACFRSEFKRDLGQDAPLVLGKKRFRPEQLAEKMIGALRAEAVRVHGAPVVRAVLTIPEAYGPADARRKLMIEAGEAAGFTAVELISEPVAAALAPPAGEPFSPGDLILVYDFGGGTFDAALVRIGDFQFEPDVLGHASLEDCGGRDIDAAVNEWLSKHGPAELAALLVPENPDDAQALAALRSRLELAMVAVSLKHQLSASESAVQIFDRVYELTMDRGAFTRLAQPVIMPTVECCRKLLTESGVTQENVRGILLAGGSSKMPAVAEILTAELKPPVRSARDLELSVLLGAARFASQASARWIGQSPEEPAERAVRWPIPRGTGTLLRWLVADDEVYTGDTPLADVRRSNCQQWPVAAHGGLVFPAVATAGATLGRDLPCPVR